MSTEGSARQSPSDESDAYGTGRFLLLALWFGLLTGLLDLVNLGIKKYALGKFLLLGPQTLWLGPLAHGILFVVVGLMIATGFLFLPRKAVYVFGVFIFVFLTIASLALLYHEIHPVAVVVLSAGVAVSIARGVSGNTGRLKAFVRRTWLVVAIASLALLIGVPVYATWREKRSIASLPATADDQPNVIVIVWDTVRTKNLSTHGYERKTSANLTQLAAKGVAFENAVATAPWTLPTHSSLFTGRWAHELEATWDRPMSGKYATLAEQLRERGYLTGGFIANQRYCGSEQGLARGFIHYSDFNVLRTELLVSTQVGRSIVESQRLAKVLGWKDFWGRKSAAQINDDFFKWIDRSAGRPYFAFLNYFDAHAPYRPPAPYDTMFGANDEHDDLSYRIALRSGEPNWKGFKDARHLAAAERAYDGGIAYMDAKLGELVAELKKRGMLDNTIIVVTSDHGEQFGEHDLVDHGNSLYQPLVHVPLVVFSPRQLPQGRRIAERVTLRDVPATVMELVKAGEGHPFPGRSLSRYWKADGDKSVAPIITSVRKLSDQKKRNRAFGGVIDDGFGLIGFSDGREELYKLDDDPGELKNLADDPQHRARLDKLRALLPPEE